jgi:hypothetical protein
MKQKFPTLAIYIAVISFLLGIVALTQAVITSSSVIHNNEAQSINFPE